MFGLSVPYPAKSLCSNPYNEPVSEEDMNAYRHTFSKPGFFTGPVNFYRALYLNRMEYDMNYKMPILVLWGMKDFALHPSIPDSIEKMCDKATVIRYPEAGHFTQMDIPTKVNKAMRDWLGEFSQ